ncbi:MAG: hypothetical protein OSJ58_10050 [Dysosmobacter sp.]|nr:hypothetical protein [Dysosmobacter sp.]
MKKSLTILVFLIITGAAIFGAVMRQSYTNICAGENYMDTLKVAEIPSELCVEDCYRLSDVLSTVPLIIRATPVDGIENLFGVSRQKVIITEVYKGDMLSTGEEVFITSQHWQIIIRPSLHAIERGFVNILQPDKEYLLFLSSRVDQLPEEYPVYQLYDEALIAPVFCYDNFENRIAVPTDMTTYVSYYDVKDNEFFATSDVGLKAWDALKQEMIKRYPI